MVEDANEASAAKRPPQGNPLRVAKVPKLALDRLPDEAETTTPLVTQRSNKFQVSSVQPLF